jgi:hypothetical protein
MSTDTLINALHEAQEAEPKRLPRDATCCAVQMKREQRTTNDLPLSIVAAAETPPLPPALLWSCLAISRSSEVVAMVSSGSGSVLGGSVRHAMQCAGQPLAAAQEIRVSLGRVPHNVFCLAFLLTSYPCRALSSTMGRIFLRSVCFSTPPPSKPEVWDAFISNQKTHDCCTCAVPYLLFRTSSGDWTTKATSIKCHGSTLLEQISEVLPKIRHLGIAPYDCVSIEHARQHHVSGMTTWHVPGTYEACAAKVVAVVFLPARTPTYMLLSRVGGLISTKNTAEHNRAVPCGQR